VLLLLLLAAAAGAAEAAGSGRGGAEGDRSDPLGALPSGFSFAGELRGSSFFGRSGVRPGSLVCARASCSAMVVAPLRLADRDGALTRGAVAVPTLSPASCCCGEAVPLLHPRPVVSSGHS
jgi:hypothetical protein